PPADGHRAGPAKPRIRSRVPSRAAGPLRRAASTGADSNSERPGPTRPPVKGYASKDTRSLAASREPPSIRSRVPSRAAGLRSEIKEEASAAGGRRGTFAEKARRPRRGPPDPPLPREPTPAP